MPLNNPQKAAVLLSGLPDDQCVEILKHFKSDDVEKICREWLSTGAVDPKDRQAVMSEFASSVTDTNALRKEGAEYVESILARAYGIRRAGLFMGHLKEHEASQVDLDDLVGEVGAEAVALELAVEHPQVVRTVLSAISPKKAADVLAKFTPEAQVEAVRSLVASRDIPTDLADKIKRGF